MEPVAEAQWSAVARQVLVDLRPFPGRLGRAWRVALLCALVAGVAMLYRIPESAIGCYLIIYLAKPDGAECVATAIGLIVLASVVVLSIVPVISATADAPALRLTAMALLSFVFVWLGAISQLGEIGSIIALVLVFMLSLVDFVPAGEIGTRVLLYAWQMSCVPMAMMVVFNVVLGTPPHRLMRETVVRRLHAAARAFDRKDADAAASELGSALGEGNAELAKQMQLAQIFHTAPAATLSFLRGAAMTSYRLMLAAAVLPAQPALALACRAAAEAIGASRCPPGRSCQEAVETIRAGGTPDGTDDAEQLLAAEAARRALAGLAQPNGGTDDAPAKPSFFRRDALTNPAYQRFALKTTGAAISCYLIYRIADWPGIHTAMVTCYVAALGTTAETVHKLALRITGCLIGAAMGFLTILLVIPHLDSVGGLMVLVFLAILPAAWVSSGNERISYAGVQIGLAFLLTVLNGFAPSVSMDSGRDRIVGILLGNVIMYLFFTGIWPKSAVEDVRERLARIFATLARLAALDGAGRRAAHVDVAAVEVEAALAREQLALLPFEPKRRRPEAARIVDAARLIDEARALLPALVFAVRPTESLSTRLAALAGRFGAPPRASSAPEPDSGPPSALTMRLDRIERLAAQADA